MDTKFYSFNPSQDVVNLQTKYTLFKRVENILFYTAIEGGFDKAVMTKAINTLFQRHDCLRVRFVKKNGQIMQYFEPSRTCGEIKDLVFSTWAEYDSFYKKFRKVKANCFKGDVLRAVFTENPDGEKGIIFKVSHYVADTYGIGVLVTDLFAVYDALKSGKELPAAPGSFEKILEKDLEYKENKELKKKDEEYFTDYYNVRHPDAPLYCGVHGNKSDYWLKNKRKGAFAIPYLFVKCDTDGMRFQIPLSVSTKATAWCEANSISLSAFYYYCFSVAASIVNDRAKHLGSLMLLDCRGTLADRKTAGTKVQPIYNYTTVDYEKSFKDNVTVLYNEEQEHYKHTRLTYVEIEQIQHKKWGHSMLSQLNSFCFSFIPMKMPKGVRMQVLSNGKSALTAYVAVMYDVDTNVVNVVYDYQTGLTKPAVLGDFQNTLVDVIEKVVADSQSPLGKIL